MGLCLLDRRLSARARRPHGSFGRLKGDRAHSPEPMSKFVLGIKPGSGPSAAPRCANTNQAFLKGRGRVKRSAKPSEASIFCGKPRRTSAVAAVLSCSGDWPAVRLGAPTFLGSWGRRLLVARHSFARSWVHGALRERSRADSITYSDAPPWWGPCLISSARSIHRQRSRCSLVEAAQVVVSKAVVDEG